MAVSRASNFTAIHAWLIVFVVLFLASAVGTVVMYTGQQQLRDDRDNAQKSMQALASGRENNEPTVIALRTVANSMSPPQPLVRVMVDEIHGLAARITGDATHARAEAEAQLDALLKRIAEDKMVPNPEQVGKNEGAVRIIARLYTWFAGEMDARKTAQKQLADATEQLASAQATIKALETKFDASLTDMKKQVDELQASKNTYEASKQTEIDDLGKKLASGQEALGQLRQDMSKQAQSYGTQIRQREDIIAQQLAKIGDVQGPPPVRAQEDALAREPVGRVLRALPGDTLVHIDLGETDGVSLGMRFAVYSAQGRVPPDGRGKANLEVVSAGPHTAECRVTTPPAPDDPILEGDKVQNVILARSRARKQRFVVVGTFDLDYDGAPDRMGPEKIKAYIMRYGGEVVDAVDAATDFVVVGKEPIGGAAPAAPAVDPTVGPRGRDAAKQAMTFEEVIRRAPLLGVPRLPQETFLNFIGLEPGADVARQLQP